MPVIGSPGGRARGRAFILYGLRGVALYFFEN